MCDYRKIKRERDNRGDTERERERREEKLFYFKELAHGIMKAGKFKIWRVGHRSGYTGKNRYYSSNPKAHSYLGEASLLFYSAFN